MIHKLRLSNFKGIRDVEVVLERLTVFVGPNASGKTSFLQGLNFFADIASKPNQDLNEHIFLEEYAANSVATQPMILSGSIEELDLRLTLTPDYTTYMQNFERTQMEQVVPNILDIGLSNTAKDSSWVSVSEIPPLFASLTQTKLYRFDLHQMDDGDSRKCEELTCSGSNLPGFLLYLQMTRPEILESINRYLRLVIPSFQKVGFDISRFKPDTVQLNHEEDSKYFFTSLYDIVLELSNGLRISGRVASEGTLVTLALLAALGNSERGDHDIILIDDIDRGLHPLAQRNLIALIRDLMVQRPNLQIIATTHSPYLVDSLKPDEVRMTTLNDDGTVACGRLVDHPKFEQWKDEMAPGEMWSMFGEKWVSQKSPAAEPL